MPDRPKCGHCGEPLGGRYGGRGEYAYIRCGCEGQVIELAKDICQTDYGRRSLWSAFAGDQSEYTPVYPCIVGGRRVRDVFRYLVGTLDDDINWKRVFEAVFGKHEGRL